MDMEEQIRLYGRDELYRYGIDRVIDLFLERQEADVRRLAEQAETSRKLANALEEIRLLKAKLFAPSTENAASLGMDEGATAAQEEKNDIPMETAKEHQEAEKGPGMKKRKAGCMKKQREGLPVIEVEDTIPEDRLMEMFGTEKISELPPAGYDVVRMRPAYCYIEHHNIHIYKSGKKIIRAGTVEKLLPHSDISSSTMAYILNGRFVMNLPANRICQELSRNGYPMNRQRVYHLTEYFAFHSFELVVERMKQVMFSTGHIQADETEVVMNEKRKDGHVVRSRMWAYLTSERNEASLPKVVIYQYELSRGTDKLKDFIKGFTGTITSDGYISYISVDKDETNDIQVSGCMTHNRRKYIDALKALSGFRYLDKEEKEEVPAYAAAKKITAIFKADKMLNTLEPEERLARRQIEVAPLVDDFFAYVHSFKDTDFAKGSLTYKAFQYSRNQEKYLRMFLTDGHIPLENSASERAIITVALGRNGWKTIATIDGATASGYMYSLAETAKRNGARPYYYFKYLLERAAALQEQHKDDPVTELGYLDPMMPWSEEYRAYEKSELEHDNQILRQLAELKTSPNTENVKEC